MTKGLTAVLAFLVCPVASHAQVHTSQVLAGYKCMMLAQQWSGEGPMPPPTPVYSGPEFNAPKAGIAGGTVIVPSVLRPQNGRTVMIFPDGRQVWIDVSRIVAWHAKADPTSTCRPVILSNGRYGTDSGG